MANINTILNKIWEKWINICNVNDLKKNTIKKFTVKETEILVARTGSNFYAFPGMCPHMEEPLDESGILNSEFLTCSKHLWQWDLKNGSSMGPAEVNLLMYKTKVEDETLNLFFEKELRYEYQEENDDDFEW
ncbi:MAG: Rieske 2Fe-2S domain-containing protein [bacterium]